MTRKFLLAAISITAAICVVATTAVAATGTVTAIHLASDCSGFQVNGDTSKWYVAAPGLPFGNLRIGDRIGFAPGSYTTQCAWVGQSQVVNDINNPPQGPND